MRRKIIFVVDLYSFEMKIQYCPCVYIYIYNFKLKNVIMFYRVFRYDKQEWKLNFLYRFDFDVVWFDRFIHACIKRGSSLVALASLFILFVQIKWWKLGRLTFAPLNYLKTFCKHVFNVLRERLNKINKSNGTNVLETHHVRWSTRSEN